MTDTAETLKALAVRQKKMEEEMEALADFLSQPGMPGLTGNLVDVEGFPRADIDLYAVRGARHRLAVLKTDYQEIRSQIEKELLALHAQGAVSVPRGESADRTKNLRTGASASADTEYALELCPYVPFAKIDELHEKSPASTAGFRLGDLVLQLGSVFIRNPNVTRTADAPGQPSVCVAEDDARGCTSVEEVFRKLRQEVESHKGENLCVTLLRNSDMVHLKLVPQTWEGMGLVGCRFTPVTQGML
ncbi:putative proteasome (prosome, macropain) 26S subunit, non-ATPase, 9 [Besnoitia besnoiti]|uniref:Putative proteasome (Prosome, macropain) 26S subunit, non-ATPase, 9 n=1 Tax=Besnoitia besnoiti TaxID=94643 RepID=A0A2A9MG09_BESBE|nr:putative proteasome (prosome, macropain) 26S subunit, non-ATPase, 9 [Besnoitia besnoiti]PFH35201.1 putative proteasome (prosome, macropain) 26S subunit, non-ATPase, 9 [Besnoitia besnoiti]